MAYKINRDDEFIVLPDGPVTAREVRKYMKQQKTPEFYELEAAEVIEVFVDEEDLPKILRGSNKGQPDWSKYGYINARMVISNTGSQNIIPIAPMDPNIKQYPYPGEYVVVANYFGELFYSQKINLLNKVDTNILPGLSKVQKPFLKESYKDNLPNIANSNIRQINVEEGDIAFNGRFGQSIRFGSNIKNVIKDDKIVDVNTGKEKSPNIIIRAGQGEIPTNPLV